MPVPDPPNPNQNPHRRLSDLLRAAEFIEQQQQANEFVVLERPPTPPREIPLRPILGRRDNLRRPQNGIVVDLPIYQNARMLTDFSNLSELCTQMYHESFNTLTNAQQLEVLNKLRDVFNLLSEIRRRIREHEYPRPQY